MEKKQSRMNIKITDEILKGVYANSMVVTHTREEFVIDFINTFPPEGIVTSRIITSPGHLKRIIRALIDNIEKYEKTYGEVREAPEPAADSSIQ